MATERELKDAHLQLIDSVRIALEAMAQDRLAAGEKLSNLVGRVVGTNNGKTTAEGKPMRVTASVLTRQEMVAWLSEHRPSFIPRLQAGAQGGGRLLLSIVASPLGYSTLLFPVSFAVNEQSLPN